MASDCDDKIAAAAKVKKNPICFNMISSSFRDGTYCADGRLPKSEGPGPLLEVKPSPCTVKIDILPKLSPRVKSSLDVDSQHWRLLRYMSAQLALREHSISVTTFLCGDSG
jgi:hypothetical protein